MAFMDCAADSLTTTQEEGHRRHGVLREELGDVISMGTDTWPSSRYSDLPPNTTQEFLNTEGGEHRNGRWTTIPKFPVLASELYDPVCRIVNSIIDLFVASRGQSAREAVLGTTLFQRKPRAEAAPEQSLVPCIAIRATGPSFGNPNRGPSSVLSNVAACIDAKLDLEAADLWGHLAQMSEYAKNLFTLQPNRFFVRSMLVTEHQAQLFHFDRSGVQYTPLFNIHEDPITFIHLIIGLCATEERILGFDDSIQWRSNSKGLKTSGTLSTVGPNSTIAAYDLVIDELPLVRRRLRGRGTTCWAVKNNRGERFVVKDYWVTDDQMREFELLNEVKGMPGVCQMVSYEDNRVQTKEFRGDLTTLAENTFQNRTSIRIVMKAYGPTIESFKSIEQLLAALRDAIAAHHALLSRNIIHRDISPNNILLGPDNADEGERGIVIDLDVALRSTGTSSQTVIDVKIGTLMFQSRMVLRSYKLIPAFIPLYTYLDDLEAFFWVFAYLVLTHKPDGQRMVPNSFQKSTLLSWVEDGPTCIHNSKFTFLNSPSAIDEIREAIEPGWQVIYEDLFLGFRDFVREVGNARDGLLYKGQTKVAPHRFASVLENVDEHYAHLLGLFDAELERLKGPSGLGKEPESPKSSPDGASPWTSLSTYSGSASSKPSTAASSATSEEGPNPCLASEASSSTCPPQSSAPRRPPLSKRHVEEAELDDVSVKVPKRRCPPRQPSAGIPANRDDRPGLTPNSIYSHGSLSSLK